MREKEQLAKEFFPTIRFHNKEFYTPTNFIDLARKPNGEIDFNCENPKENWRNKAKFDGKTKLFWFSPGVYVHFLENKSIQIRRVDITVSLVIQYWFYFAFNAFYWGGLEVPLLEHIHDWEWLQLALSKTNQDKYHLISYSISAHGTSVEITNKLRKEFYRQEGFHCNRGSHNFASIFQLPNQNEKKDIIISPDTLIPISENKRVHFKETLIFLDDFTEDYLAQFSFFPLLAAWERDLYNAACWTPKYWSWSVLSRFFQLSRGFGNLYQRATRRKI